MVANYAACSDFLEPRFSNPSSERLDPALTRPGRVDREFQFLNAGLAQLSELFKRFFNDDTYYTRNLSPDLSDSARATAASLALDEDAAAFTEKFRGRTDFSLAEVQGMRKSVCLDVIDYRS